MDAAQEQLAAPAIPIILAPPTSMLPYNISLNISSLIATMFPTTLLSRIRKGIIWTGKDQLVYPSTTSAVEWGTETLLQAEPTAIANTPGRYTEASFPGPWAFFTSWYMVGLFFMAVMLHRIQNIIIPSRRQHHGGRRRHAYRSAPHFAPRFELVRRLYDKLLPLDFSHTTTRLVLHLPSAYFLTRMLCMWLLLVLQTSELYTPMKWAGLKWLDNLIQWNSAMEMNDICWGTFCAVCAAFLVEGFIKALDGMATGFPLGNANPNTSPFNLVGYAFLLHVYSSPLTHSFKPLDDSLPSRPDKHVLITIAIPLLQLTIFHLLSIKKRLSTHRLLPTALTSMLSLLHFHGTLFSHYRRSQMDLPPDAASQMTYPLLNYIPNFFETLLISSIFLTISLNAMAQILVRGRIDRVLSGLGFGHGLSSDEVTGPWRFFANLPLEEDFGVLLLRVGIASLEATGLKGWGNEVAPIAMPNKPRDWKLSPGYGTVRMTRTDISNVGASTAPPASASNIAGPSWMTDSIFADQSAIRRRRRAAAALARKPRSGFSNEVRTIDLGNSEDPTAGRAGYTSWWLWVKELYAYLGTLWSVLKGLVIFLLDRARGRVRISEVIRKSGSDALPARTRADKAREFQEWDVAALQEYMRKREEKILYQQFLRGEDISDDDDDPAEDTAETSSERSDDETASDGEEWTDVAEDERHAEAISLFTDLLRNGGQSDGGGELVLAHLLNGGRSSSGPLTRHRWNALAQSGGREGRRWSSPLSEEDPSSSEETLRDADRQSIFDNDPDAEQRFESICVICTSEKRDIICWPCRCLAMCDGCREALASKSAATKHRCPCCRQTVDGYSKIFIP